MRTQHYVRQLPGSGRRSDNRGVHFVDHWRAVGPLQIRRAVHVHLDDGPVFDGHVGRSAVKQTVNVTRVVECGGDVCRRGRLRTWSRVLRLAGWKNAASRRPDKLSWCSSRGRRRRRRRCSSRVHRVNGRRRRLNSGAYERCAPTADLCYRPSASAAAAPVSECDGGVGGGGVRVWWRRLQRRRHRATECVIKVLYERNAILYRVQHYNIRALQCWRSSTCGRTREKNDSDGRNRTACVRDN